MILLKYTLYWFFLACVPVAVFVTLNLKARSAVIISILIAASLVAAALFAFVSVRGYMRYSVFWFFMVAIFIVTLSLSERTIPGYTNALRAATLSIITVIIPFALMLLNQYWPTFAITHASNLPNYECKRNAENQTALPSQSAFHVKNQSASVLTNTQFRYMFVSSKNDRKNERIIDISYSGENFNFGPQEDRAFLFSFNNLQQHDHLFLIVQLRHRAILWPFTVLKVWEVFNYSPGDCLWVTMRKNNPDWSSSFRQWYQILDQGERPAAEQ